MFYTKDDVSNTSDSNNDDNIIDSLSTMPIEIKARVAHTTFYAKRHQLETNVEATEGMAAFENGEPVYHSINAEGGELQKWIPKHKESFQLLHHIAVCNKRKRFFLLDNETKIIFGVFVTYSDSLIESYQAIFKDLYKRSLKPFYDGNLQKEKIEKVIDSKEMKKIGMSYHSFETAFYIW